MNPAWLSGKMPKDMYTHEHPEAPRLKTRMFRKVRYEEEELENEEEREAPGPRPLELPDRGRGQPRPVGEQPGPDQSVR